MKRKIGTSLDERLYERARDVAHREGRNLNDLMADALERYLAVQAGRASIVAETKGTYKVSTRAVRTVLEEDEFASG